MTHNECEICNRLRALAEFYAPRNLDASDRPQWLKDTDYWQAADFILAQSAEITRLTAERDAAYAAGAEAMRAAAVQTVSDMRGGYETDLRTVMHQIHALPIPPRGEP